MVAREKDDRDGPRVQAARGYPVLLGNRSRGKTPKHAPALLGEEMNGRGSRERARARAHTHTNSDVETVTCFWVTRKKLCNTSIVFTSTKKIILRCQIITKLIYFLFTQNKVAHYFHD